MNKPHKHAALMLQFAQDAAETETPWERWEYKHGSSNEWLDAKNNLGWSNQCEYRRKPRTININGFEVPEPLREKPETGVKYWVTQIPTVSQVSSSWNNDCWDNHWLPSGLCHLTLEAAELHAKALLSFTKQ